jgi:hypothetical protein
MCYVYFNIWTAIRTDPMRVEPFCVLGKREVGGIRGMVWGDGGMCRRASVPAWRVVSREDSKRWASAPRAGVCPMFHTARLAQ